MSLSRVQLRDDAVLEIQTRLDIVGSALSSIYQYGKVRIAVKAMWVPSERPRFALDQP